MMKTDQTTNHNRTGPADLLLRIAAFFIILEPVWMLLPFAGFLYGSVMHIEALSRNRLTAPLVHFVFPTHTLFPLGLLLILGGLLIFLAGAFRIYRGKIRKSGLIRTGLYRRFRHPQYLALTVFGIGIILTWGRLISYIAFFVMLWLYYFLARREEEICRRTFGAEYDRYRDETRFLFPGDEQLLAAAGRLLPAGLSAGSRAALSFLLVVMLAAGSGLLIGRIRSATRHTLPALSGTMEIGGQSPGLLPVLMVKGPALQAAPSEKLRAGFMANAFRMLLNSPKIAAAVQEEEPEGKYTLLAFPTPGSNWYSSHLDFDRARINFVIFCLRSQVAYNGNNFNEFRKHWQISRMLRVNEVSRERWAAGLDPVEGEITSEPYAERMEERVDFFLSGLH